MNFHTSRITMRLAVGATALLFAAVQHSAHAASWTTTGPLNVGREAHTATLLTNGLVLVAGGYGAGGALASVESYDPVSGTWTTNNSLNTARRFHTATLLPNGSVLVVGGNGSGGALTNVESFDPTSGNWTISASLASSRQSHSATLLQNGQVLVAGGEHTVLVTSTELATAVMYDPTSGTWSNTTSMHTARYGHTATLLADGTVLVAGGYGKISLIANGSLNSVELYNPATATWTTNVSLQMNAARDSHTATLLRDGRVLVAGGEDVSGSGLGMSTVPLASAELYDPASGTWSFTGSMQNARYGHTATLLPDGHVMVAGGFNSNVLASAEDYDPASGTWTTISSLNTAREIHTATLLTDGSVLVAGGYNAGYLTSAELLPQPAFSDIEAGLPGAYQSSVACGDYDNDGRLDFLLTGTFTNGAFFYPLWHNTGSGFTNVISSLTTQYASAWGDFNNDGQIDILDDYYGIWANTGNDFSNINVILSPSGLGTVFGSVAWGDYDNDGRPDVLLSGYTYALESSSDGSYLAATTNSGVLWHNTSDGFNLIKNGPPGVYYGSVAWGDYDGDGRLDILITGIGPNGKPITQVWRNTGNGFTNINAGLPGVAYGSAVWGDYDNDGRLDILLTGATNLNFPGGVFGWNLGPYEIADVSTPDSGNPTGYITQIWRNTGNGFTNINAGLPGVWAGSAAWGDYDNDGRLDVLLTGATGSFVIATTNYGFFSTTNYQSFANGFISQVWRNTGSGFTNINAGLPGVGYSSAAWGDYDNDGRLDILLSGATAVDGSGNVTAAITQIWRNNTLLANTPPTAPSGLNAALSGNTVTFSWNGSGDAQTTTAGLSYNLRVGTTPGGGDLVGPMSGSSGQRRVVQSGNAQQNLSRTITGLPFGQPIYWSVQAIDTAFAGSAFAPEQTFTFNTVFTPPNGVPVPGDLNGDGIVSQSELADVLAYLNGNGMVSESELDLVLSNYWPYSPWLYMTNIAGLGGTNVTFALTNSTAVDFSVQYSTDLVNWSYLGPATLRYLFTDTNAPTVPQRFYRLRWP